ncbi:hydroxyacid dehydrogenase [Phytoactinopolyspora endophytica]|uniref:hydroxyacid dehydrogenase n=1 Tax=Phytoactinopolyspora endophytica TaxID=1642495 RepID=UPI00101CCDD4|nr:hydroxyacid dehydrogenase [Phytoactinopolyspora endophytica]
MSHRPQGLFAMRAVHRPRLFPPPLMKRLAELCDIDQAVTVDDFRTDRAHRLLAETEVLITGWGCPTLDADVLDQAPRLRAILHAAGSVKTLVTPQCWERGIVVSSAATANAIPTAEYALAAVLMSGKQVFVHRERYRRDHTFVLDQALSGVGNFGARVGVVGASRVGRRLIELMRPFDLDVSLFDPYVEPADAAALGVQLTSLDQMLSTCDVISLNAPLTADTSRMIDRDRLAMMRDGATLVNTARGGLVDNTALADELVSGRLSAVLDVTDPEPLPPGSVLFDLPNVFLTPHVAGSQGNEVQRLGRSAVDELERLVNGDQLAHQVTPADLDTVA